MGEQTKIEWAHHTFNPWRGCTKVSAGCANCYAETMSKRNPAVLGVWGDNGTRVVASEAMWREPLKWNREARERRKGRGIMPERPRVFCASLADVFEDRPELEAPRGRLLRLIDATRELDWLLLTKRPENVLRMIDGPGCWAGRSINNPPPNVWMGVSVENNKTCLERVHYLRQIPARVKFLSCEPLLEDICDGGNFNMAVFDRHAEVRRLMHGPMACNAEQAESMVAHPVNWVIVGGESGPKARPCNVAWIRSIVAQCKSAGVACFVKQLGSRPFQDDSSIVGGAKVTAESVAKCRPLPGAAMKDPKGGDPAEWPEELRVREVPR